LLPMYPRDLVLPDRSFFLFGPRGTGKTTWLRAVLPDAHWIDLLSNRQLVRLTREPDRFGEEVEALAAGQWIVVDDVQRLPKLLDQVQQLLVRHARRWRFALTASSTRRLKREQANLLAGRVVNRRFFPLTASELGTDFHVETVLRSGCLPAVHAETGGDTARADILEAYAENSLTQEIRQEALVKRLDSFTRFLEVAALANARVTNVSAIARDAAVARPTVQGYFEILVDTLVGVWLPAWRPRAKIKELAHPKFYFFDPGTVGTLGGGSASADGPSVQRCIDVSGSQRPDRAAARRALLAPVVGRGPTTPYAAGFVIWLATILVQGLWQRFDSLSRGGHTPPNAA